MAEQQKNANQTTTQKTEAKASLSQLDRLMLMTSDPMKLLVNMQLFGTKPVHMNDMQGFFIKNAII